MLRALWGYTVLMRVSGLEGFAIALKKRVSVSSSSSANCRKVEWGRERGRWERREGEGGRDMYGTTRPNGFPRKISECHACTWNQRGTQTQQTGSRTKTPARSISDLALRLHFLEDALANGLHLVGQGARNLGRSPDCRSSFLCASPCRFAKILRKEKQTQCY